MKNINEITKFEELNLKQTFRAHIIYEQIMGHGFITTDGLNGVIVLFYSYIMGSNRGATVDYNQYMDWIDDNPEMLTKFTEWIQMQNTAKHSVETIEPAEAQEGE